MNATQDPFLKRTIPAKQTGDKLTWCGRCFGPVVDSPEGRQAHKERLGHWPVEREK